MSPQLSIEELFLSQFVRSIIVKTYQNNDKKYSARVNQIKSNIQIYKEDELPKNLVNNSGNPDVLSGLEINKEIKKENFIKSIAQKEVAKLPKTSNLKDSLIQNLKPIKTTFKRSQFIPQQVIKNTSGPPKMPIYPRSPQVYKNVKSSEKINFDISREGEQLVPSITQEKFDLKLPRLEKFIFDTSVQTIECPGPNKPILIYSNGNIKPASFSLTGDEINNIMKEISDKTRIPLMSGVFKAAYGNLIVTAVMSEFVGTRFIIQKKMPIPQAPSN